MLLKQYKVVVILPLLYGCEPGPLKQTR